MFRLQRGPLSPEDALGALRSPSFGGIVVFLGRVRPDPSPRGRVAALDYEAYPKLARKEVGRLEEEAIRRHGPLGIAILHRTGRVPVGEVSVVVAVGAPHRKEAFQAARLLMDGVKRAVPIWKTEVRPRRSARPRRRPLPPGGAPGGGSRRSRRSAPPPR